jgi:hypothetical protein
MNEMTCRAVVRGSLKPGGERLRTVRFVNAPGDSVAECMRNARDICEADGIFEAMARERRFVNVTTSILPPTGFKLDGGISKGWGLLPDGKTIEFVSHKHPAGAPVPSSHQVLKSR